MLLLNCISRILFIKSNLHKNGKEKKDLLKKEDKEIDNNPSKENTDDEDHIDKEKINNIEERQDIEKIKYYNNHKNVLAGLEDDDVIAIVTEILQAEIATQNNRDLTFITIDSDNQYNYGFVFNKNSKLTNRFNKIIDDMMKNRPQDWQMFIRNKFSMYIQQLGLENVRV